MTTSTKMYIGGNQAKVYLGSTLISDVGGSTPWTPNELTTSYWGSAKKSITQSLGDVSSLGDDSSLGANPTIQAVGSRQPTYSATGWDGVNPTITYNGSSDFLEGSVLQSLSEVTIVAIYDQNSTADQRIFGIRSTGVNQKSITMGADNYLRFDGAAIAGSVTKTTGKHIRISTRSNSAQTDWIDGVQNISGSLTLPDVEGYINIGKCVVTFTLEYSGEVAEALIIPRIITEAERLNLEGYLAHEWDQTTLLPVAHPYKSAPPTL